jgi:carbon-monoxide dehydrogenase small subunit
MTIAFTLNGAAVTAEADPSARLLHILRDGFRLTGCKCGCLAGRCGVCTVIFNGTASPACLVPAFRLHGGSVLTVEGFAHTPAYADIAEGFRLHHADMCAYCAPAKALLAETLLSRKELPISAEIRAAFAGIRCRCSAGADMAEAVLAAAGVRRRRLGGLAGHGGGLNGKAH